MRLLVFGGRDFGYNKEPLPNGRFRWVPDVSKIEAMWDELDKWRLFNEDFAIVSGSCPTGADFLAEAWAASRGVPVERYPADWSQGKSAGPTRNEEMAATRPDLAIAFPGGRGTDDMFRRCQAHNLQLVDMRHDPTLISSTEGRVPLVG